MKKFVIVIPVLNPNNELFPYIDSLIQSGFTSIIVIDDGSVQGKKPIFDQLKELDEVIVLTHAVNLGKGRALKNAFNYILNDRELKQYRGVITVDGDGQHTIEDVIAICKEMDGKTNHLSLGVRQFKEDNVPFKSRLGNTLTKSLFKLLYGKTISDTQTGLRGISMDILAVYLNLEGERYSYETNVLIASVHHNIQITEVPIETIYINENEESHFKPIKDSTDIYVLLFKNFFKFMSVSLSSFLIDISFFQLFLILFSFTADKRIILATIFARGISSFYNYSINRKFVFDSDKKWDKTLSSYYLLVILEGLTSAGAVYVLYRLTGVEEVALKVLVDGILFVISYRIQKFLIF